MTQLISKIKFVNEARTEIELMDEETGDNSKTEKKITITSDDIRHNDFTRIEDEIMKWIKPEFKISEDRDLTFKTLHIKRHGGMAIQVTVFERFDGKPGGSAFTWPALIEGSEADNKMPIQLYDAVIKMIEEAQQFIDGKRAQGSLALVHSSDIEDGEEEDTNLIVKKRKRK